jgi:hypothetical protein
MRSPHGLLTDMLRNECGKCFHSIRRLITLNRRELRVAKLSFFLLLSWTGLVQVVREPTLLAFRSPARPWEIWPGRTWIIRSK